MVLIGIAGKKGHGKDTIAEFLVAHFGFTQFAFATPLKEACQALFGFDDRQLYGDTKEEEDPYWKITPRHALQFLGTNIIREQGDALVPGVGNEFWLRRFRREYDTRKAACGGPFRAVVSDVRFQNEVDYIVAMGGIVIKVHRPGIEDEDTHASERGIDGITGWAHLICNDGTVDDLRRRVSELFTSIGYGPAVPTREPLRYNDDVPCADAPCDNARLSEGGCYKLQVQHAL